MSSSQKRSPTLQHVNESRYSIGTQLACDGIYVKTTIAAKDLRDDFPNVIHSSAAKTEDSFYECT